MSTGPMLRPLMASTRCVGVTLKTSKEHSSMKNVMVALVAAAFASVALAQGATPAAPAAKAAPAAQAAPATQAAPTKAEKKASKKASKKAQKSKPTTSSTSSATDAKPAK